MTRRILAAIGLTAATLCLAASAAAAAAPSGASSIFGVWRNPKNSVHVEIKPCGEAACGYVIWANAKAKADALEGSGKDLIGMELLHDLSLKSGGSWRGKVFVPDMTVTLTGIATPVSANQLEAKGCVLGRLICKTQKWTRISSQ
jgi:uncharacterized protein (DUF2147 family)